MSVNLMDLVKSQLTPEMLSQLGGSVGADAQSTGSALSAIVPALIGRLSSNASSEGGASAIWNALDRDHDGSVLNDLTGLFSGGQENAKVQDGDKIVNHILGEERGPLENNISMASGLDVSQIGGLMARFAPVVMGLLGQQKQQQGLDISGLMGLLGGQTQHVDQAQAGGAGGFMGMITGMLDQNKDGNVMDDAMGMLGNLFKK